MRLTSNERVFLKMLGGIAQKLLHPWTTVDGGGNERSRTSAADVAKIKRHIRAVRKRKVPVAQIAKELGVTTSYIYQLGK